MSWKYFEGDFEGNIKEQKKNTHKHFKLLNIHEYSMNMKFNILAGRRKFKNYSQYGKIGNTSYQMQVVKRHFFLIFKQLTFNKHIHLGPTQSLSSSLLNV